MPFVVDPTLMMHPVMQAQISGTEDYVWDFGRCGGTAGYCLPGQKCTDAANLECSPASECVRMSEFYWQCRYSDLLIMQCNASAKLFCNFFD